MDDDPSSFTLSLGLSAPSEVCDLAILPLENQQCVMAEFSAVEHMLCFAAMWLHSVDPSTIPLEDQGWLAIYAGQVWTTALRFPHVRQTVKDSCTPLPMETAQSGTATPVAPLNEESLSLDWHHQPRCCPHQN
jgi:hypothetical protein